MPTPTPVVQHMLTTVDNPYDPFTQFDEWLAFDFSMGYNTCGLLSRIVMNSEEISEIDKMQATEWAIDEIIKMNVNGMFKKVTKRG